jgi:prepilin-type N-terminal cleavage/methylation domain-containing protein
MPTSSDRRRGCRGFTLLEVLVTLAIVAAAIVPLLVVRDATWNIAYRSGHMLKAAAYAEAILAARMTNPDDVKDYQAVIEDDPAFSYELTIEGFDLSTGRADSEDETDPNSNFSVDPAFLPQDAHPAPEDAVDVYKDPQHVRRFKLKISYPGLEEDKKGEYLLEGYLPMAKKEPDDAAAATNPAPK